MHTATLPTNTRAEVQNLALSLLEYADTSGRGLDALHRDHPGLPSTNHLKRFASGDTPADPEDATTQAERLRPVVADLLGEGLTETDELYDDLTTTRKGRGQFGRLLASRTAAKLILLEGYTGSGKTSLARVLMARWNNGPTPLIHYVEGTAGWADRPNAMLSAFLDALDIPDSSRSQAARLRKLVQAMAGQSTVLFIDEAHDFGVRCLRVLKTLLNETPVKIILACHPSLFRNLERENWDDLSQLTGNRLLARVRLGGHDLTDVATLLTRRLPQLTLSKAEKDKHLDAISRAAQSNGNLAFVRQLIVRLQSRARREKLKTLTPKHLTEALKAELADRGRPTS